MRVAIVYHFLIFDLQLLFDLGIGIPKPIEVVICVRELVARNCAGGAGLAECSGGGNAQVVTKFMTLVGSFVAVRSMIILAVCPIRSPRKLKVLGSNMT